MKERNLAEGRKRRYYEKESGRGGKKSIVKEMIRRRKGRRLKK